MNDQDIVSSAQLNAQYTSIIEVEDNTALVAGRKAKSYDGYLRARRPVPRTFRGQDYDHTSAKKLMLKNCTPVDRVVLVNDQVWLGIPQVLGQTNTARVELGPGELLYLVIDGTVYSSATPTTAFQVSGLLEDAVIVRPRVGGQTSFVVEKDNGAPIAFIDPAGVEVVVTDEAGRSETIESRKNYLTQRKVENVGVIGSFNKLPTADQLEDLPIIVRRGVKSFQYRRSTGTESMIRNQEITRECQKTYRLEDFGKQDRYEFEKTGYTFSSNHLVLEVSSTVPDTPYSVRLYHGTSDEATLAIGTITLAETVLQLKAGKSGVVLVCDSGLTLSGDLVSQLVRAIASTYFDAVSESYRNVLILVREIDKSVTVVSSFIKTLVVDDTNSVEQVDESTILIKSDDTSVPFEVTGSSVIQVQSSLSGDAMAGTRFSVQVDMPLTLNNEQDPDLSSGVLTVTGIHIHDVHGKKIAEISDLIVSISPARLHIYGKLDKETIPGVGNITVNYSVNRIPWEGEQFDENSSITNDFTISENRVSILSYKATRRTGSSIIGCDIYVKEPSYMLLNRKLVAAIRAEGGAVPLSAIQVLPDGKEIDLLGLDRTTLEAGWNSIEVSEGLFMVPMIDRGELDPAKKYSTVEHDLGQIKITEGVATSPEGRALIEKGYQGGLWLVINNIYHSVTELLDQGFRIDFPSSGSTYKTKLVKQTHVYRRFSNRFYQLAGVDESLRTIPGPVFYLSGTDVVPASTLTNLRDMNPDFTWGFVLGDFDQFRIPDNLVSCPSGVPTAQETDDPDTLLLPVAMPKWLRWLADGNPMARVASHDIDWNLPANYEEAYSLSDTAFIRFSSNHIGNLDLINILSAETSGDWPILVVPYDGDGAPVTNPEPGDILYFGGLDPVHRTRATDLVGQGTVANVELFTNPDNTKVWRLMVVTRTIPDEPTTAVRIYGRGPRIISHILGRGPSNRVSAGYELTFAADAPMKLHVSYRNTPGPGTFPTTPVIAAPCPIISG